MIFIAFVVLVAVTTLNSRMLGGWIVAHVLCLCILIRAACHIIPRPRRGHESNKTKTSAPGQTPSWATSASSGLRHVPMISRRTRRAQNLSILVHMIPPRHSPLRHRLRTCRACRRRYQKRMQSSLAPPGRAIRRPLNGWPLPTWRVCQREAPHPVAGGGHWRRSDRDGPVTGGDLDLGPARDGDVVLTRDRCETVVPAR